MGAQHRGWRRGSGRRRAPEDLDELRASLRRGPRGSRVDRIVEHNLNEKEAEALDAFRIEGAW